MTTKIGTAKWIVCLVALLLAVNSFAFAGQKKKGSEMSGTICDQKCVKQDGEKATCDASCTEKSGEAAFIDDQGKSWKVANPAMCKGKMGKKVKVMGNKTDDNTLELLKIYG